MDSFTEAYRQLNAAQKQAVDTLDGPVLVLAGPGTGKTQLLSARVANILQKTDTPAGNILCLTFTESGAENMRERLTRFIGQEAYNVGIGTYHAFGGDLIRRYPEYFAATRLQHPIDELGKRQILLTITENMSFANPLRQARHHIGDLMTTISEAKRALLEPDHLRAIARENIACISAASAELRTIFESFTTMPRSLPKAEQYFTSTLQLLRSLAPESPAAGHYGSLASIAADELAAALDQAREAGKTKPLTEWKNNWLAKNDNNQFILSGELENSRILSLAIVLEQYHSALEEQGLYDFDDMIIRSIQALEKHADLRYTLQERYLYLLLDEFQDTNAAQLRLIELLTNNPVHEGRPNVMAVGDDDQAIYAFQGAKYSNMRDFYEMYRDVAVISLSENYRSTEEIITTAQNISSQIETQLKGSFDGVGKSLVAANTKLTSGTIERVDFLSHVAERDYIAQRIHTLISSGVHPSNIAVLAPKHKHLEPLVPYLNALDIPVRYEKRENILDAPVVKQLLTMCRLLLAIDTNNQALANHLWPQVLSFDFWELAVTEIWQISWQVSDNKDGSTTWNQALLQNPRFRLPALLLLGTAAKIHTETAETILDYLMGNTAVNTHGDDIAEVTSPLRDYYTSPTIQQEQPELFYATVSNLTVLRARLLEHQRTSDTALTLVEFMRLIAMYEEAEQQMINTSPYSQQADAVQLMTVFKAKGLEYEYVFLPGCQDDIWGSSSRDNSNKLTLPANLQPIRHAGATDDERLRILYVAITRARLGLILTAHTQSYAGKPTKRLKYFDEQEQPDDSFSALVLPAKYQRVEHQDTSAPELELLEIDWRAKHIHSLKDINVHGLLKHRLDTYQVSPTHVTDFINLEYSGPQKFYFKTILKFPEAQSPEAQFGTVIHGTLEWLQHQVNERGSILPAREVIQYFRTRMAQSRLTEQRTALEIERGEKALHAWLSQRGFTVHPGNVAEKNFHNEGVFIGDARMSGRVDNLEVDKTQKTITVVDYKTGKSYGAWRADPKLYRYRLQLYLYKLLIENSLSYRGYTVQKGRLEFIEPDERGKVNALEITFDADGTTRTEQLVSALWQHVQELNFPDVSSYPVSLAGIKAFEQDLLVGTI